MDNQQERSLEYVAGILDGESSFSIIPGRNKGGFFLLPVVQLSMLHHETVEEVANILRLNGVGGYLHHNQKRGSLALAIKGYKRCKRLIEVVGPYLLTKREQASIMQEFIDSRLARAKGAAPTIQEITLIEKIRGVNSHVTLPRKPLGWLYDLALKESSETTRSALVNE